MGGRFPWNKNTSEDIAEQTNPQFETPQGAQIKANTARDEAIFASNAYTDVQTGSVVSIATGAQETAQTALINANNAQGVAGQANSKANTAQTTADTALANAATAQQTADNAQDSADMAQARADAAYELAEQSGGVVNSFGSVGGITADSPGDTVDFIAGSGMQINPDPATNSITFATTGGGSGGDVPDGTLLQKGIVQLSSTAGTDETKAATPKLVKDAYDAGTQLASTTQPGQVQLDNTVTSTSTARAGTANAVKTAYDRGSTALTTAQTNATTTTPGRVQLNDTNTSTSTTQALTANAGRVTYEIATALGSTTQVGRVQTYDGIDSTRTDLVATANAVRIAASMGGGGGGGTTAAITYYVDGLAGNDANNGTSTATAFKTVQKASDSLPKQLNHDCAIYVKGGISYSESLNIMGFFGSGSLLVQAFHPGQTIYASITQIAVRNCSLPIKIIRFTDAGVLTNGTRFGFYSCVYAEITNCSTTSSTGSGIFAAEGTTLYASNCTVSNTTSQAIASSNSRLAAISCAGTGNAVGYRAAVAGTVGYSSGSLSATTLTAQVSGGVVRT